MTKIKVVKKKLKVVMTKNHGCRERIKRSHDKNQGSLEEKLKVGVTKIKIVEKN